MQSGMQLPLRFKKDSNMTLQQLINPDLAKERQNASFDVHEFAAWFNGGADKLKMKRTIEQELFKDMEDQLDYEYQSYEEICSAAVKQTVNTTIKLKNLQDRLNPGGSNIYPDLMLELCFANALIPAGNPMGVHFLMFSRTIKEQGTPELYEKFGKRAEQLEIIGSYAQTELGHGTFIRGLETRADYDSATDEFVLNTPSLTAYKWWPGGLGHVSNHCILVAQLYINNQPKGMQLFVLPLRDERTHAPLPGIDVGEISKKIGLLGVNNGYLGLKDVRIPRTNMLMRYAKVRRDGSFAQSPVSQLAYFPMIFVRCSVAHYMVVSLLEAATIATRYSAVRRQSPINPNAAEPQILDHVTQQLKLLPELATGLAYHIASERAFQLYDETLRGISANDFARLPELHALACVLKAGCSYDAAQGIERLRLACGGHGYLTAANLGSLHDFCTAACTFEGENTVMYLQVGRILMKTWHDVQRGVQLMPTMAYLEKCAAWKQFPSWTGSSECLVQALQYVTTNKVRGTYERLQARLVQGQTQPEALNNSGIELAQAAELHGRTFVAQTFLQEMTGPSASKRSGQLNKVLSQLLELYLLHTVQRHMGDILRFISLSENDVSALQVRLESMLQLLRPDAVAICDSFDFHDRVLNSVLGAYDGNVYERIFEAAKRNPMNQKAVPKFFEQHLKPLLTAKL